MTDAELMKQTRKELYLTQTEMAQRLGYASQVSISRIERGKNKMDPKVKAHLKSIRRHEL